MTIKENLALLKGLQERVSHPRLESPAPSSAQLSECYRAAFRSPDHAWLRPWRFIECRDHERDLLGKLLTQGLLKENPDMSEAKQDKVLRGPLRAPLVIICCVNLTEHPKVPEIEQYLAAGCAANNLISALYALGFGAVWRTGESAHSHSVHTELNLEDNQRIVGYIYVGTPSAEDKVPPVLEQNSYVRTLSQHLELN